MVTILKMRFVTFFLFCHCSFAPKLKVPGYFLSWVCIRTFCLLGALDCWKNRPNSAIAGQWRRKFCFMLFIADLTSAYKVPLQFREYKEQLTKSGNQHLNWIRVCICCLLVQQNECATGPLALNMDWLLLFEPIKLKSLRFALARIPVSKSRNKQLKFEFINWLCRLGRQNKTNAVESALRYRRVKNNCKYGMRCWNKQVWLRNSNWYILCRHHRAQYFAT